MAEAPERSRIKTLVEVNAFMVAVWWHRYSWKIEGNSK